MNWGQGREELGASLYKKQHITDEIKQQMGVSLRLRYYLLFTLIYKARTY